MQWRGAEKEAVMSYSGGGVVVGCAVVQWWGCSGWGCSGGGCSGWDCSGGGSSGCSGGCAVVVGYSFLLWHILQNNIFMWKAFQ